MDTVRLAYDLDRETAVAAAVAFQTADPSVGRVIGRARWRVFVAAILAAGWFGLLYAAAHCADEVTASFTSCAGGGAPQRRTFSRNARGSAGKSRMRAHRAAPADPSHTMRAARSQSQAPPPPPP